MRVDEHAHLVDRAEAARVALALRVAPREETVAAEHDSVAPGMLLDRAAQHERELESGALPREPDDAAAEFPIELVELLTSVPARRQRDGPVRVEVIDVRERKKRMQRRIDRRRHAVLTEGTERVQADHLVLVRFAAIAADQPLELVEIQEREAARADGAQVAAAPLHGQHARGLAGQRVGQIELRTRIAAAKVRDPKVGPEQVRAIAQEFERCCVERGRVTIAPQVPKKREGDIRHTSTPRTRGNGGTAHPRSRLRAARSARPETIDR
jgi:hypothetical protein